MAVAISGRQQPALLCSAVIPPGVCRHLVHDDIGRRMKLGAKDAPEKSHGFLDETGLFLGRIGAGGDRRLDMNGNLRRRAAYCPAGNCRLLHQYAGEVSSLAENGCHQVRHFHMEARKLFRRERGTRDRNSNEGHWVLRNLPGDDLVPAISALSIKKKNEYI